MDVVERIAEEIEDNTTAEKLVVIFRQFFQHFNHFCVRRFVYSCLNGVLMLKLHAYSIFKTQENTKKVKNCESMDVMICLPASRIKTNIKLYMKIV